MSVSAGKNEALEEAAKGSQEHEELLKLVTMGEWDDAAPRLKALSLGELEALRDENGFTAAHHAAKDGRVDVLEYLLDTMEVDVDVLDDTGSAPLYRAVGFGQRDAIDYLVARGASLSCVNFNGDSLLHNAAYAADELFCEQLLDHCDPFLPDKWNVIPLMYLIDKVPRVADQVFDGKITEIARHVQNRLVKFDFRGLDFGSDVKGLVTPIRHLVAEEKIDLLKHPLIDAYFQVRWDAFGKRAFVEQMFEYLVDLAIISAYAVAFERHVSGLAELDDEENDDGLGDGDGDDDSSHDGRAFWARATAVLLAGVFLVVCKGLYREAKQLTDSKKVGHRVPGLGRVVLVRNYWQDGFNWMDLAAFSTALAMCAILVVAAAGGAPGGSSSNNNNNNNSSSSSRGLDAACRRDRVVQPAKKLLMISLLLFWSKFLKLLGVFQATGPAVRTIIRMLSDLSTFFSFYVLFWISFSLAWFVQYGHEIGSLWKVTLTVLEATVLGDAGDIGALVRKREGDVVVQVLYVAMLLLMPLMLCNLLIAMMGNSYAIVQYRAMDEWRIIWVTQILEAQAQLSDAKVAAALPAVARANFDDVPVENQTNIDVDALRKTCVFDRHTSYQWRDKAIRDDDEDHVSLLILRTEVIGAIKALHDQLSDVKHHVLLNNSNNNNNKGVNVLRSSRRKSSYTATGPKPDPKAPGDPSAALV